MSKWSKICTSWQTSTGLEDSSLLGCDAELLGKWVQMFQRSNLPHLQGFMVIIHESWTLDKKVTHSSEASATPYPATQWHIPVHKVLITLLWNLTTNAYRFHNWISENDDPNPRCCRVTKPYGIKNVTIKTIVSAIWIDEENIAETRIQTILNVYDNLKQTQPHVLFKNKTKHPLLII